LRRKKWKKEKELKKSEKAYRDNAIAVKTKTWGDSLRYTISTVFYPGTFWGEISPPNFEFSPQGLEARSVTM